MSYTTIYVIGALCTLIYYFLFGSQRLYREMKEKDLNVTDEVIRQAIVTTAVIYSLFWFICVPFILLPNIFKK